MRFDDDRWLTYVPLRLPRTLMVEERLPPGAAAVLLNQSHTYPDLYLPVNDRERRLFEAIDGRRTVAEILRTAETQEAKGHYQRARGFFERLWWYDQVVFDASH